MGMQPLGASDAAKPALEHAMLTEIRVAFTVSLDLDLDLTRQPKVPEPQPPGAAKPGARVPRSPCAGGGGWRFGDPARIICLL